MVSYLAAAAAAADLSLWRHCAVITILLTLEDFLHLVDWGAD
jgi:hypothetical protein